MGAVNDFLIFLAEGFTGLFNAAGDQFASFITGMIPMLICLILTIKAVIQLIGEERVYGFMKKCTKYAVLRYTLIPFLCTFFLCNPMAYTFGVFVEEDYKPAFYDAVVSMMHPIVGLFPHAWYLGRLRGTGKELLRACYPLPHCWSNRLPDQGHCHREAVPHHEEAQRS